MVKAECAVTELQKDIDRLEDNKKIKTNREGVVNV